MKTIYRKVDDNNIDISVLEEARDILREGNLVAFPTETVYGLGANALDEHAAAKIYENIKKAREALTANCPCM